MTSQPAKIKTIRPQHKLFADEWLACQNGTKAAIAAGYAKKTARQKAVELLKHPLISQYIAEESAKRSMRLKVTADRVLEELARIAFLDPSKIFNVDEHGNVNITPTDELNADQRACIAEISQTISETGGSTRLKLHDKLSALDKLSKHLKLFSDGADVNITFQQMGRVVLKHTDVDGTEETLDFDIGLPPDEEI